MAGRIGKTRQKQKAVAKNSTTKTPRVEEVYDPAVGRARGMLRRPLPAGEMRHARRSPSPDLSTWIAHYWMIQWDLRGCDPHRAESLPHPNVHVIFEPSASVVSGVHTQKFSRLIAGQSQVFGIKFKPGAFRPFLKYSVSKLADRMVPMKSILAKNKKDAKDLESLQSVVLSYCAENEKVKAADAFFSARMPKPDKNVELAAKLVETILEDREIKAVDDLAAKVGIGKRSLQRLFNDYVGVSPKWVIRRYRLHELIERAHSGQPSDWSQLALELGYFDQAHLINDFRKLTGFSPTEYQALVEQSLVEQALLKKEK